MIVSHPKIRTFTPVWERFRGYSLILEDSGRPSEGKYVFTESAANISFFKKVSASISEVGETSLARGLLLFLLPPHTYHVTFADLINEGNIKNIGADNPDFSSFRAALSPTRQQSMKDQVPPVIIRDLPGADILERGRALRLSYTGFSKKSGRALTLKMAAADAASSSLIEELKQRRTSLVQRLGLASDDGVKPWRPHLSIGYFGNRKLSRSNPELLQFLSETLQTSLEGQVLEFDGVGLYAFEDMANFFPVVG